MGDELQGTICLRGITARGNHGVYESERVEGQQFIVDVELGIRMPSRDDLSETVDYSILAQAIEAIIESEPVNLIETLAEFIAARCLEEERVISVEVRVHKPHAPINVQLSDVSVHIIRRKV